MGAKKYTRVSDTGLVMHVTRSIDHDLTITLNGTGASTDTLNQSTTFQRKYVDTNYNATFGDKEYNRAGHYLGPVATNAISTFYTVFGGNPQVECVRLGLNGEYLETIAGSSDPMDSRLSMDVFGDPLYYLGNNTVIGSIPSGGTDAGNVFMIDPEFIVTVAGTNKEYLDTNTSIAVSIGSATDLEVLSEITATFTLTSSFSYPSDGLAYPDGGHLYRSMLADTRGQASNETNTAAFAKGLSALGLLPKTEVYVIDENDEADILQYPGKFGVGQTSYSPRIRNGEVLPATSDADLRGFHGQYWVSSRLRRIADSGILPSNDQSFRYGKNHVPFGFGFNSNKSSYSKDTIGAIPILDSSENQLGQLETYTVTVLPDGTIEKDIQIDIPIVDRTLPNEKGERTNDPNRVQDYRSVVMRATYNKEAVSYPFTVSDFEAEPESFVDKLKLRIDTDVFDEVQSEVSSGAITYETLPWNDEYSYVRYLVSQGYLDATKFNFAALRRVNFGPQYAENSQPRPENPALTNFSEYIDPRYLSFDVDDGLVRVSQFDNPSDTFVFIDRIGRSSEAPLNMNDSTTYDYSTYTEQDYAEYLRMINIGEQGSYDMVGYNARAKTTSLTVTGGANVQKTINKLRFSSNTVSRKLFGPGEYIAMKPENEASFGVVERAVLPTYIEFAITSNLFNRFNESLPARPDNIFIGDPIRFYFCSDVEQTTLAPITDKYKVIEASNAIYDIVIGTTAGPISLSRDLGLSQTQIASTYYFDLNDPRLSAISQVDRDGFTTVFTSLPNFRPQVQYIRVYNKSRNIIENVVFHHLQEMTFKYEYFNKNGHLAHSMYRDPISTIRNGTYESPTLDPGFLQSEGGDVSAFGYPISRDIISVVEQNNVANINVQIYNPMFGRPRISDGNLVNSVYNYANARRLDFRRKNLPFLRQGLVYNENARVINANQTVNLIDLGYAEDNVVPVKQLSEAKFTSKTDIFGRARITGVPINEVPEYDDNGIITSILLGGDVIIDIPENLPTDDEFAHQYAYNETRSNIIDKAILSLLDLAENSLVQYQDFAPKGLMYVDQGNIGVAFRSILADIKGVFGGSGIITLPRTSNPREEFNGEYGNEFTIIEANTLNDPLSNIIYVSRGTFNENTGNSNSIKEFKYLPVNFIFYDQSNSLYMTDYDNGIIDYNEDNGTKTKNMFHPKNSMINDDFNGIFYFGESREIMFNYMFAETQPGSIIEIQYRNFLPVKVQSGGLSQDPSTLLNVIQEPVQPVPFRIERTATTGNGSVRYSPASYIVSDYGMTYISQIEESANAGSISSKSGFPVSYFTYNVSNVEINRVLNLPIKASSESDSVIESRSFPENDQFEAYRNFRENTGFDQLDLLGGSGMESYQGSFRFESVPDQIQGFHPKNINYAVGPSDLFFGTATVLESEIRQVTRKMSFGLEVSKWGDFYFSEEPTNTAEYGANLRYPAFTNPMLVLPAGTYTFILNIQDMKIPVTSKGSGQSGVDPIKLINAFNPTQENGLQSNFYWNIPASEINNALFTTNPTVTRSDSLLSVQGVISSSVDPASTYYDPIGLSANVTIQVRPSDDFSISSFSNDALNERYGSSCDNGILYPRTSPLRNMNIEGNPGEVGSNGEYRQNYKTIRIDMYIDNNIYWGQFKNIIDLGISFRPNTQIPRDFIVPKSTDGVTADRYLLYGSENSNTPAASLYPLIPRGEYPCFARIGSVGMFHSKFFEGVGGPNYINGLPADFFDHLPNKRQNLIDEGVISSDEYGLSFLQFYFDGNTDDRTFRVLRSMLGFHTINSFNEVLCDGDIPIVAFGDFGANIGARVNRSIIQMGHGMNVINLAGMATYGQEPIIRTAPAPNEFNPNVTVRTIR
jgi:hypothetical protein